MTPYCFRSLVTRDIDELVEAYKGWNQNYQKLTPDPFWGQFTEACFAGFFIHRETLNQPIYEVGQAPQDCYTFCVPLQIQGEAYANGHIFDDSLLHHQVMMLGVNADMAFRTPNFIDDVVVSIPKNLLDRYAATVEGWDLTPLLSQSSAHVITKPKPEKLGTALLSVLKQFQDSPQKLSKASTQRLLGDFILEQVLTTLRGTSQEFRYRTRVPSRKPAIDAACDYIEAHPERPITVAELCTVTGFSRSTLQAGFQAKFSMSPKKYLKVRRLNGARLALLEATPQVGKVTDIATAWGFWHMGAFGQDYKTLFGELPSQTLMSTPPGRHSNPDAPTA